MKAKTEVMTSLLELMETLLKDGVAHTSVWKRVFFRLSGSDLPNVMKLLHELGLGPLLLDNVDVRTKKTYPTEHPTRGSIWLEEFDYPDGSGHIQYTLDLDYVTRLPIVWESSDEESVYSLRITFSLGKDSQHVSLTGYAFVDDYYETGYEGHGWKSQRATSSQLKFFLELLTQNAEHVVREKPLEEQLKEILMVDQDGNKKFYNSETKEWDLTEEDFLAQK